MEPNLSLLAQIVCKWQPIEIKVLRITLLHLLTLMAPYFQRIELEGSKEG
jgi:hypothetical protein